jgi:hypothetical protein
MCPMVRYPMWKSWLSPFRRSQQKTLTLVIAAAASVAQASSLAVAGHLAARLGIQRGSAWNRLYRLLRNPRVDERLRLLGAGRRLRIALDGTEWHHDLKMRVASGDPGPGGGLSQDADIPVAKWVGAYVPEAAGPYPAGDRPDGGPAGRPGLSSGLGVTASAGAEAVVRRSPGRRLFHPVQAVDLRQDKAVRVLGVWAPGQEEPWSARPPGRPGGPV